MNYCMQTFLEITSKLHGTSSP